LRRLRFFFEADCTALRIELHHAVAMRILDGIGEHGRTALELRRVLKLAGESLAVKNVVAEHKRAGLSRDEILADKKRLREAVRAGLHGVADIQPPAVPVAQELGKT